MELYDYKIMLVDDEPELRRMVKDFLVKEGFRYVVSAGSCREARAVYQREQPRLILLDVMLPDGDGFGLLQEMHKESEVPVIFLSAKDEDEDRLHGLGLGADDYITKPFLPKELILRVKAVLKRVYRVKEEDKESELIRLGVCSVDLGSGLVRWNSARENVSESSKTKAQELTLTAKEYAIIEKLAANRGRIVTIDALCEAVWQEGNYGYENTLIVHIRRLREKIEEDPSHPKYLLTVRGLGYKLI
ncbi:MAG: response regulator transcription factor [Lachnospiraceae bacterium]|nr:response regulator transcription factor [Lachnospiraceae bacterium]